MVEGFPQETAPLTEQEIKMARIIATKLKYHRGVENAVSNTKMQKYFQEKGMKSGGARIRKILHYVRTENMVSCLVANSKGYYIATSSEDMKRYTKSLQDRIDSEVYLKECLLKQHNQRFRQGDIFQQSSVDNNVTHVER